MRRTEKRKNTAQKRFHKNPRLLELNVSRRISSSTLVAGVLLLFVTTSFAETLGRRKIEQFRYDGSGKVVVNFFDADSTLRVAPSGNVSANSGRDVWILPMVSPEIAEETEEGKLNAIISNQAGAPKFIALTEADAGLNFARQMIQWLNPKAVIHYYDFAENRDNDRKPGIGMFERLEREIKKAFGENVIIDKERSVMVGDSAYKKDQMRPDGRPGFDFSDSDRKAAENYGIRFIEPSDFFGWKKYGVDRIHKKADIDRFYEAHPELKLPVRGPCPFPSLLEKLAP